MERLTSETLIDCLVDFAHNLRFEDLSPEVAREAKRRLIDTVGCALGGCQDYAVSKVTDSVVLPGPEESENSGFVLGRGALFVPEQAAYANTHMIRVLDWNDTYLSLEPAHPSDNIGTLMAIAGMRKISGKDFLTAMVLAYDIQCRFCDSASLRGKGWDHTYYVQIASSFAAAKLLGLTKEEMKTAVSLAMRRVPLRQVRAGTQLSMAKGTASAEAVREAVWSVLLAQKGMTGPSEMVDGKFGMIEQVTGPLRLKAFRGLGRSFKLPETYIKLYPVEYHAQAVVEAGFQLRKRIKSLENIEWIKIISYEQALAIIGDPDKRKPKTKESADHSIYYILALTLLDGEMTLAQYDSSRFTDRRVLNLINKMGDVFVHPEYNAEYGAQYFPVFIEIKETDKTYTERALVRVPRGHPKNPLTDKELEQKFREVSSGKPAWVYFGKALDRLLENIKNIEDWPDVLGALEGYVSPEEYEDEES